MTATVRVDGTNKLALALRQFDGKAQDKVAQAIRESAKKIRAEARERAPVGHSGQVRKSIKYRIRDRGLSATIGSGYYIARFYEFGTAPHRIKAKNKGGLKLPDGSVRPAVDHPGQPPRPFMLPTWEEERGPTIDRIEDAVRDAAQESAQP